MITNRWTKPVGRGAVVVAALVAPLAACGGDDENARDGVAPTSASEVGTTRPSTSPATTSAPTTSEVGADAEVADAEIIDTIELGRGDLGFLISDGEALWATGSDGAVVRIDPDTGEVDEVTIGDGLVTGQLLPVAVDDSIWFSAIQGSHIVRLDRTTLAADPPIEVPDGPGLIVAGPDDRLWLTYLDPTGLRPIDVAAGTVGELVTIPTDGEVIGVTAAFGALWAPLYDERELVQLDATGAELDRVTTGVGPSYVREFGEWLWHPNWVDGTVARVDPTTLDVAIVDLNAGGPTIEQPSAAVGTADAVWVRAARMVDGAAMVFRIDTASASIDGRRTLDGRRLQQIGGMATVGDRVFVLDRPGRVLLELDTDRFLDGDRLTDQIAAFKQFFADNMPGEEYAGEAPSVRIDGDVAEIEFFVVIAGEPVVDTIRGTAVREDGRWLLSADSFCRLIATGGIECPADLGVPDSG